MFVVVCVTGKAMEIVMSEFSSHCTKRLLLELVRASVKCWIGFSFQLLDDVVNYYCNNRRVFTVITNT